MSKALGMILLRFVGEASNQPQAQGMSDEDARRPGPAEADRRLLPGPVHPRMGWLFWGKQGGKVR